MIERLYSLEPWRELIADINSDPLFSEPMLSTEENTEGNLESAVNKPYCHVLGVTDEGIKTGLFVFDVIDEDNYLEMLVGLSRSLKAYEEAAAYLAANFPGYKADFVFNPMNTAIRAMLEEKGAHFDPEMQRMTLKNDPPAVDTAGIELLSEKHKAQYCAIHTTDCYWTGEKVAEAPNIFNALLAVDGGEVVGYIDITNNNEENEPFDLLVKEDRRRRGWGRKLLAKAIELNRPHGVAL
jgi:Acetyltransferase (GNAT) family.